MTGGSDLDFEDSNRKREKIALVLFISIIAVAICVVVTYFGTARAFNVAATKVDEKAGTMEFCSSIIYSGVLTISTDLSSTSSGDSVKTKVFPSDVRSKYIDKQASVVTVDLNELSKSEQPLILDVGEKQVGIFAVQNYIPKNQVIKIVDSLKNDGANVILCIAPRSNMLGTTNGINAILCTKEKSPSETTDDHIGDTFLFRAAQVGKVGVISISNSNAFIQKIFG